VTAGNQVYTDMCAGCHGPAGEGQASFPALTGNANVTAQDATQLVTNFFNLQAHPFLADMTPDQIAQVLSYTRVTFGNNASVVCSDIIESLQPAQ
jgi:mono/diheme cytochrome c family protein